MENIKITSYITMEMVEEWEKIEDIMIPYKAKHAEEIKRMTDEAYLELLSCLGDNYQNPRISEMSIEEVLELPYAPVWAPGEKKKLTQIWKDEETLKKEEIYHRYWLANIDVIRTMTAAGQNRLATCIEGNYNLPGIMDMSIEEVLSLSEDKEDIQIWKDAV